MADPTPRPGIIVWVTAVVVIPQTLLKSENNDEYNKSSNPFFEGVGDTTEYTGAS